MAQNVALASHHRGGSMPKLITGAKLRAAVENGTFIVGGDVEEVEAVKYDFHMGSRVLKALYGQPKDLDTIPEENRWVDPGEAVFLLTREKLDLPANMFAVLTPKRKLAHAGIMMLGGLAVDPSYKGVLLLGLYNFSSTRYPIRPGSKLIGAVFYELDKGEICDYPSADPEEIVDFPDDLVRLIQNYKPVELKGLQESLAETQRQLDNLRTDLTSDKEWREDFRRDLEDHNRQLGLLIEGLKEEKEARKEDDNDIKNRLESMSNLFFGGKILIGLAAVAITAVVTAAITIWVTRAMEPEAAASSAPPAAAAPLESKQKTESGLQ